MCFKIVTKPAHWWSMVCNHSLQADTSIESYMARLVVKNGRQKDTFYYDIGLYGQNVSTILGSILNTTGWVGGLCNY